MLELPLIIVPDPEVPEAAEVLVDGAVNKRPRRFLLDTGAARSQVLSDSHTVSLVVANVETSHGAIAPTTNDLVRIPELTVGPLRALNLDVTRVRAEQPGARNLVGMDVLTHHCCRIDLARHRLFIEDSPHPEARLPLVMDKRGHCYVELSWAAVRAQSCVDTGASLTIVDQAFIDKHPDLFTPAGTSVGTDSTGSQLETPLFLMTGPVVGGMHLADHKVAAVDLAPANATLELPMDLILGYPTLRQASWLFDFPARRWSLS